MNEERWYDITGFQNYQVEPYKCLVRNKKTLKLLTPQISYAGYYKIVLPAGNGKHKTLQCHRLFMDLLPGEGPIVNHIDGVKTNWHISNLEKVSLKENVHHAINVLGKKVSVNHKGSTPLTIQNVNTKRKRNFKSINETATYFSKKYKIDKSNLNRVLTNYLNSGNVFYDFKIYRKDKDVKLSEFKEYPKNTDYRVSKDGRVYSILSKKILNGYENNGYLKISVSVDGRKRNVPVHRMVAETFLENPDNLPMVDHIDRNKLNNRVDNLRWVTASENARNSDHIDSVMMPIIGTDNEGRILHIFDSISSSNVLFHSRSVSNSIQSNKPHKNIFWRKISKEEYDNLILEIA